VIRTAESIGVALFPDHGATWQTMYKSADLALYDAKRGGRATWRWYAGEEVGRE
jgi:GGDEF domain-containing protein